MRVTEKHKQFIRRYLETGNATRAYMEVMNNENYKYCKIKSCTLLADPDIKAYAKEVQQEISDNFIFGIENVQKFWIEVMLDENEKMPNRMRASEDLARSLGGFTDKQDVNVSSTVIFKGEDNIED